MNLKYMKVSFFEISYKFFFFTTFNFFFDVPVDDFFFILVCLVCMKNIINGDCY